MFYGAHVGLWSTQRLVPLAPTGVTLYENYSGNFSASWTHPVSNGVAITGYYIWLWNSGTFTVLDSQVVSASTTSIDFSVSVPDPGNGPFYVTITPQSDFGPGATGTSGLFYPQPNIPIVSLSVVNSIDGDLFGHIGTRLTYTLDSLGEFTSISSLTVRLGLVSYDINGVRGSHNFNDLELGSITSVGGQLVNTILQDDFSWAGYVTQVTTRYSGSGTAFGDTYTFSQRFSEAHNYGLFVI